MALQNARTDEWTRARDRRAGPGPPTRPCSRAWPTATAAFEELYARHAAWPVVRLTRRCADPGLVDEVVQDRFVAVWRSGHPWDGPGEVGAWVRGIAIRRLVDGIRAKPRTLLGLVREDAADVSSPRSSAPLAGSVASAEDAVLLGVQYGDPPG